MSPESPAFGGLPGGKSRVGLGIGVGLALGKLARPGVLKSRSAWRHRRPSETLQVTGGIPRWGGSSREGSVAELPVRGGKVGLGEKEEGKAEPGRGRRDMGGGEESRRREAAVRRCGGTAGGGGVAAAAGEGRAEGWVCVCVPGSRGSGCPPRHSFSPLRCAGCRKPPCPAFVVRDPARSAARQPPPPFLPAARSSAAGPGPGRPARPALPMRRPRDPLCIQPGVARR